MPSGSGSRKHSRRGAVNARSKKNLPLNFVTGINNNENEEEPMTPRTAARLSTTRHVSLANQNRNAGALRAQNAAAAVKAATNAAEAAKKTARNAALAARAAEESAAAARLQARRSMLSKAGSNVIIGSTRGGATRHKRSGAKRRGSMNRRR